jgi:hypothetical protein
MAGEPFYLRNGLVASNTLDLANLLIVISDDEFYTYVNQSKNDFANWVEYSLQNKGLADGMRNIKSRLGLREFLKPVSGAVGSELSAANLVGSNFISEMKVNDLVKSAAEDRLKEEQHKRDEHERIESIPTAIDAVRGNHSHAINAQNGTNNATTSVSAIKPTKLGHIGTNSPSEFVLKEFLYGALFGLLLGLIISAVLYQIGALSY